MNTKQLNVFDFYSIIEPGTPILNPEFHNPLFLKLFCKSIQAKGLAQIPAGVDGITSIIEFYLDSINTKLSAATELDYDEGKKLVIKAVSAVLSQMVDADQEFLSYDNATTTIDSHFFRQLDIGADLLDLPRGDFTAGGRGGGGTSCSPSRRIAICLSVIRSSSPKSKMAGPRSPNTSRVGAATATRPPTAWAGRLLASAAATAAKTSTLALPSPQSPARPPPDAPAAPGRRSKTPPATARKPTRTPYTITGAAPYRPRHPTTGRPQPGRAGRRGAVVATEGLLGWHTRSSNRTIGPKKHTSYGVVV